MINEIDRKIIQLMADGLTMKEIAPLIQLTECTVDTYRFRLYKKLKVKNAPECVAFALRNHIIS